MNHWLHINVFEPANMYEVPWPLPASMIDGNSNLRMGTHQVEMVGTMEQAEEFLEWASTHGSILKVIGYEPLQNGNS